MAHIRTGQVAGVKIGGIENGEKDTIIKGKWWVRAKGEVGQKESVKESADNDTYLSHYAEGLFVKGRTETETKEIIIRQGG